METKDYNRELKNWKEWFEREKEYERRREELDKEFGHDGFNFGPYTIITDPSDLLNPDFILPGLNLPFSKISNTDQKIPSYFGKRLKSELDGTEGVVIGYGYDAFDDYIQIRKDDGKEVGILVNSRYDINEYQNRAE